MDCQRQTVARSRVRWDGRQRRHDSSVGRSVRCAPLCWLTSDGDGRGRCLLRWSFCAHYIYILSILLSESEYWQGFCLHSERFDNIIQPTETYTVLGLDWGSGWVAALVALDTEYSDCTRIIAYPCNYMIAEKSSVFAWLRLVSE